MPVGIDMSMMFALGGVALALIRIVCVSEELRSCDDAIAKLRQALANASETAASDELDLDYRETAAPGRPPHVPRRR